MDVARDPKHLKQRRARRMAYIVVAVLVLAGVSVAVGRLKPAPPSVDGSSIWPGEVQHGTMVRQVRGLGTLVPVEVRTIPAITDGRIIAIPVLPGAAVKADTVLLQLANPATDKALSDAKAQLAGAEADLANQKATLQAAYIDAESTQVNLASQYDQAKVLSENDQVLLKKGLVAQLDATFDATKAGGLKQQVEMGKKRLASLQVSDAAQIASAETKVAQMRNAEQLAQSQKDSLTIRAGIDGLLEALDTTNAVGAGGGPLQVGQWVTVGTPLAKVVQPQHLKAEIKVAETDARDVALDQPASIDTHNGVVPGHVIRIAPNAMNGTVTVDVALDGLLPQGARPDLSVDGTINIQTLNNVNFVGRPAFGQPDQAVSMFKISSDGRTGTRVKVDLGKASVNTIQVLHGLNVGDWVVLSDTSAQDSFDRIRFSPPVTLN